MRIAFVCRVCYEIEWREGLRDQVHANNRKWHTCRECQENDTD